MSFTVPNSADATYSDQAELDSRDLASILGLGHQRYGVLTGCAVTAQGTPDMTVAVASGNVLVGGKVVSVSSQNATIGTADASNARFDLVTVSGSQALGVVTVVAGTASSNPVFPDPSGKTVLAAVYVPASATSIASNQITDKRVVLAHSRSGFFDAHDYGAVADDFYTDGSATSASTTFTSASAGFTSNDVGKTIVIYRAGSSSAQDHHTTISSVTNSTTVVLSNAAGRTQANCRFYVSRGGDQTTAIQAAIDAAAAAGGGTVLCGGVGYLVSTLTLKNRVWLRGAGMGTTLIHQLASTNAPVVMNDVTANAVADQTGLFDLRLDGNRSRQSNVTTTLAAQYTAGATTMSLTSSANFLQGGGMVLIGTNRIFYSGVSGNTLTGVAGGFEGTTDATAASGATVTQIKALGAYFGKNPSAGTGTLEEEFDPHHTVENVHIKNTKGDGIAAYGQSESRWNNVWVQYSDEVGFRPSYDHWMYNCTADTTGRMGFLVRTTSIHINNCKAFFCGGVTASNGYGWWFEGPTNAEEGMKIATTISAQDCKAGGIMFYNAQRCIISAALTSNSTSSAGTYPAVTLHGDSGGVGASLNIIDFLSTDRTANNQSNALTMDAQCTNNKIRFSHGGANGITLGSAIASGADLSGGNDIQVNGMGGTKSSSVTTSYTPDPYGATTHRLTLGGNLTISTPSNAHLNCPLRFIFTQDATGARTVTWPSNMKSGSWTVNPVASGISYIEFTYDGTNWVATTSLPEVVARGGSVLNPTGSVNIYVWRAPYPATVTAVKGIRRAGTSATVNARKNGTLSHLATDITLSTADTWTDGGTVQNATYAVGDSLEIQITGITGTPTEVGVQVEFTRA